MSDSSDFIDDEDDDFAIPRKNREDDEMDITPMIDITFLLLIFFIVCSTMDPTKIGTIPEADNGLAISAKNSAVIFIKPSGSDSVVQARLMARNLVRMKMNRPAKLSSTSQVRWKALTGHPRNTSCSSVTRK